MIARNDGVYEMQPVEIECVRRLAQSLGRDGHVTLMVPYAHPDNTLLRVICEREIAIPSSDFFVFNRMRIVRIRLGDLLNVPLPAALSPQAG